MFSRALALYARACSPAPYPDCLFSRARHQLTRVKVARKAFRLLTFLFLAQGVEIVNDELGNVWATRGSKNNFL